MLALVGLSRVVSGLVLPVGYTGAPCVHDRAVHPFFSLYQEFHRVDVLAPGFSLLEIWTSAARVMLRATPFLTLGL